jgi:hypothetical protein
LTTFDDQRALCARLAVFDAKHKHQTGSLGMGVKSKRAGEVDY